MQNRDVFRWAFVTSGFWLMLSPFLLFGTQAVTSSDVIGDAGLLIIAGMLALVIASFSFGKRDLVQAYLGLVLGVFLVAAPLVVEFSQSIAIWNACIIGVILALVALFELYQDRPRHHAS